MGGTVTGDRYLNSLVSFVEKNAPSLIDSTITLKLNPVGLRYVQSRLEALSELEALIAGAPVDYLRAYVSDLGDHRALEQLRRILCRLTSLKIVSILPSPARDPTPLSLVCFGRLKALELRGCGLSNVAAKGLLELRFTLEKLVCHNSTDALRHVFASRIADIKESPQWNRLSFVSCACNGLILMDESLQLLPAVETLDLSRNKFTKIDNLRKCRRLTHLDLGFNQLRSVALLTEITCHISKIVLRSNALTSLRGIETLRSLAELDVSYNIISNYLELEVLSGLPSLKNLWLEGNPLCCARWYRPQVFSFFTHPEHVKLDDREMSKREFWKTQIILARRQRKPASYGFYTPAREENEEDTLLNGKKKKLSRVACIEGEGQVTNVCEQDSLSCDNETQGGDEKVLSDNEGAITGLINRIEQMRKERPMLWLDSKGWIDQGHEHFVDGNKNQSVLGPENRALQDKSSLRQNGDLSKYSGYASESSMASVDDRDTSFVGSSASNYHYQWLDCASENGALEPGTIDRALCEDQLKFCFHKWDAYFKINDFNSSTASASMSAGLENMQVSSVKPAIEDIIVSRSSSLHSGSPPHYQEDILHRRQDMEEEFLQLSVESISAASSDSDTSCDDGDFHEFVPSSPKIDEYVGEEFIRKDSLGRYDSRECISDAEHYLNFCARGEHSMKFSVTENSDVCDATSLKEYAGSFGEKKFKRKPKTRVVSLSEHNNVGSCGDDIEDPLENSVEDGDIHCSGKTCRKINLQMLHFRTGGSTVLTSHSSPKADSYIENYFNSSIADSTIQETATEYIICNCIVERKNEWGERQVALILSNKHKLYLLLEECMLYGSGDGSTVLSSHKVEDVSEVSIGLGLQVVRVFIDKDTSYVFITKSMEKTRHLLCMMELSSQGVTNRCVMRSLEQAQVQLFERQICRGLGIQIYQYSMVLFSHNPNGEHWVPRSIFINAEHIYVCVEDVLCFGSLATNPEAAQYFSLDSQCSIACLSELVVEAKDKQCVTLAFRDGPGESCLSAIADSLRVKIGFQNKNVSSVADTWKLRWSSADSLFQFVAVLKAIYIGVTQSSLSIRYVS